MRLIWSSPSQADLMRLHRFLLPKNRRAAANALRSLRAGAQRLLEYPQLGERIADTGPSDVRKLLIGDYELRYDVRTDVVVVLRIWHTRENR